MAANVLLVDDDPRNIFALSAVLKSRGFKVIACNGAKEAIDICNSDQKIDIVLMDMMMPGMDGYEAIPLIREIPTHKATPIIAVTAQAMVGDREKSIGAGADGYVSKPVDIDKLMAVFAENKVG
ncbi:response regulator [Flavobacterium silvaticum]|uniref:Response regulator n=1 Tax=Flavobacterium silvaticum TaxID=1852020 RepID=A0A972JJA5_9FLAO|nr:response regulator [Flavobacterium silvaticum]NMH28017.1 response regulator [Flavobacterium silvaticum]